MSRSKSIQTLKDGAELLKELSSGGQMTAAELSLTLDIKTDKIYRMLNSFKEAGFIVRRGDGLWGLGPSLAFCWANYIRNQKNKVVEIEQELTELST